MAWQHPQHTIPFHTHRHEVNMAKTNFQYEKRQRELEKKRKAEEKAKRKQEAKRESPGGDATGQAEDSQDEPAPQDAA